MWASNEFCSHPDYHSNIPEPDCGVAKLSQVYFKNQVLDNVCDPALSITAVVSGDTLNNNFRVCRVLKRSLVEERSSGGQFSYWLAPNGGGQFILSMKEDLYDAVELVNTHNSNYKDRATKHFRVSLRYKVIFFAMKV